MLFLLSSVPEGVLFETCSSNVSNCLSHKVLDLMKRQVLGYVFGRRKDEVFLELKKLLEPFGIHTYCTHG